MSSQELQELIASLSPEQQAAVEEFVRALKKESKPPEAVRRALEEFVRTHQMLLGRLAK